MDLLRTDASMKNIPMDCVMDYKVNPPKDKMSMIKEMVIIDSKEDGLNKEILMYMRFKMPLMSDRDNVALIK